MSEVVTEETQPDKELQAALDALFEFQQPVKENIGYAGREHLRPDLVLSVAPNFPEDLAAALHRNAHYLPDDGPLARFLGFTADRPECTIYQPFSYMSVSRSGSLPEEKAWVSVSLEQLEGRMKDDRGITHLFLPGRKLLTAKSFRLSEDGRSISEGVILTTVLGSQDKPTFSWVGYQEGDVPIIDLEKEYSDDILAIVKAASSLPA